MKAQRLISIILLNLAPLLLAGEVFGLYEFSETGQTALASLIAIDIAAMLMWGINKRMDSNVRFDIYVLLSLALVAIISIVKIAFYSEDIENFSDLLIPIMLFARAYPVFNKYFLTQYTIKRETLELAITVLIVITASLFVDSYHYLVFVFILIKSTFDLFDLAHPTYVR